MRKTISANSLQPTASLRFLYKNKLGIPLLKLLTSRWVSIIAGKYLNSRLSIPLIKKYIIKHNIDMSLYINCKYNCFNEFFTRQIKPELRPFNKDENCIPAPCDGKLSVYKIENNLSFNVKGFTYTLETLLKNKFLSKKFQNGYCYIFRLTVEDYHRYFYPVDGFKEDNIFIKGKLHTVQPIALEQRKVFTENCREYTIIHSPKAGDIIQMEVGAMMVGRIVNYHKEKNVQCGEEKGRFEFGGSTIILLTNETFIPDIELIKNTQNKKETIIKCGEAIAYLK